MRFDKRQQHADGVLGHRIGVAAGLIDDDHAGRRAGIDIDGIKAGAVAGDQQQVRRAAQQVGVGMEMGREFIPRGADLVDMRRGQDRCRDLIRTLVLEPVEPHIGARLQDVGIDLMGEIFDVEDALVVDGHRSRNPWVGKMI